MEIRNICPICGSPLENEGRRLKCRYCGYSSTDEASQEETSLLSVAFQKLRLADFEEAGELFSDIVRRFPNSSESYWGATLAAYGIKYEDDYDGKKIPTCYATRYEPLVDSDSYKKAISLADPEKKTYYESQAQRIDKIRAEWISKAEKEPPYDVFLSFKDTDEGKRTSDSEEAYEIYNILTGLGYRVFFSRVTLANKAGENFEPYIFAALNSAPVMLIYASRREYVESTWVRNEWSRYIARIKQGQKQEGSISVIFKDPLDPSKLPVSLRGRQHLKRTDIAFLDNLRDYVDKYVSAAKEERKKAQQKAEEEQRAKREKTRKRRKRIIIASSIFAAAAIAVGVLVPTVVVPAANVENAISAINSGDYASAISMLNGKSFGQSENVYHMAQAGVAFSDGDYETGIDHVLDAGGEVKVNYVCEGPVSVEKSEETIRPKKKHIDNPVTTAGYTIGEWRIDSFEITVSGASYTSALTLSNRSQANLNNLSVTSSNASKGTVKIISGSGYTDETISVVATPKAGYRFTSWTSGSRFLSSESEYSFTMPSGDYSISAEFEAIRYSITYDFLGGAGGTYRYSYTVEDEFDLASPAKNGYDFSGWADQSGEIIAKIETGTTGDLHLTAKWSASLNNLSVTSADTSKGTVEIVAGSGYTDEAISVAATPKAGYRFVSWRSGARMISSSSEYTFTMPAEDYSIEAVFEAIQYTISYDLSGGTGGEYRYSYTIEDEFDLASPSKDGYTFLGWEGQSGDLVTKIEKGTTGNLSFKASWSANLNALSVTSSNGSRGTVEIVSGSGYTDETISVAATPNPGYRFVSWRSGARVLSSKSEYTFVMPAGSYAIEAVFETIQYSITYDLSGGTGGEYRDSYTVEDEFDLASPAKNGYEFSGWDNQGDGTITKIEKGTIGDLSLTAVWSPSLNNLSVTSSDTSKGTAEIVSGSGYSGEEITVKATPADGCVFKWWSQGKSILSKSKDYTFTMPLSDYSITAVFWTKEVAYGVVPTLSDDGKYVSYGMYPQTKVSDASLIAELNAINAPEACGWYAWDDEYFAKYEDDWFNVELIRWNILERSDDELFIVSNYLLDAHRYNLNYWDIKDGHYANNYAESEIRAWLNTEFYSMAFALGDDRILTTEVDNSASTTGSESNKYACENTMDKVFLLSYQDYKEKLDAKSEKCSPTDYARGRKADVILIDGARWGWYWTRSPRSTRPNEVVSINDYRSIFNDGIDNPRGGVRPAMRITLAD